MVTSVTRRRRTPGLLWLVLLFVVGSFALLVAALVTSGTSWAWGSVAASGAAGGLLVADWAAARRAPRGTDPHTDQGEPVGGADDLAEVDDGVVDDADPLSASPTGDTAEPGPDRSDEPGDPDAAHVPIPDPDVEPAEERADAADAIATADLAAVVRVIDERPRYHVPSCRWVGDRESIDIELAEARELGFTPCAVCRPDATLAARVRAGRASSG